MRRHYRSEMVEGLPTGFIYRYGTLSSDGHRIRTEVLSSDEGSGIARQGSRHEWLYSQREVTELLYRLGFSAITYDEKGRGWRLDQELYLVGSKPCGALPGEYWTHPAAHAALISRHP